MKADVVSAGFLLVSLITFFFVVSFRVVFQFVEGFWRSSLKLFIPLVFCKFQASERPQKQGDT